MNHKIVINSITPGARYYVGEDNTQQAEKWLEADFSIVCTDEGGVSKDMKLAFPIMATEQEITDELSKYLATFLQDIELGKLSEEVEMENDNVIKVGEALVGTEISFDQEKMEASVMSKAELNK